jgi:hypothetical protein
MRGKKDKLRAMKEVAADRAHVYSWVAGLGTCWYCGTRQPEKRGKRWHHFGPIDCTTGLANV